MADEVKDKEDLPYGGKPIIPNEERRKYGLAPIPGGDVEIISIRGMCESSDSMDPKCQP